ncbi:MAG: zinc ribbon domain-containing protein [Pseudomonadales bacterium]|nr:zinc ribbon domain-containing protein [Pseudomonadales bacterium]
MSRINPKDEWVHHELPELRIIDEVLWKAVKDRQSELEKKFNHLGSAKRPVYLLSGLLKCGECGGGYSKINQERYGCSTSRNKGASVCANKQTIKSEIIEKVVLDALEANLMNDELVEVFCEEYTKHMNALRASEVSEKKRIKSEALTLTKEKDNLITAIKSGVPADLIKDELEKIVNRMNELDDLLELQDEPPRPLIHPTMARRYKQEVTALKKSLKDNASNEVREHVRALIEKVVITPATKERDMRIDLHGDLAGILNIAIEDKAMNHGPKIKKPLRTKTSELGSFSKRSVPLVAGAGFEPTTYGL